jgi:hypothetical protein
MPQEKPKKKLTKQEQNTKDATTGGGINSRPVFTGPNSYILPNRDIPLATTPEPKIVTDLKSNLKIKAKKETAIPKYVATGVVISKKDEKAHPEDFKYLKNK